MRILHFSDAHIDMANYGRHDPQTGLPVRVMDFLKSLDRIVNTAISEKVDLVIFAGDAYKDRNPAPTFQREWGKRIMALSMAKIPTVLLVGNHDNSPALGRANSIQEFETLQVPFIQVVSKPCFLSPAELNIPVQIIAIPWISKSSFMSALDLVSEESLNVYEEMETRLNARVQDWIDQSDPQLPLILTAHASIQGASLGSERTVMLGSDLVLPGSFVKNPRLDYVALGHIHKAQDLNEGSHPPVVYSGSIERLDFGEAGDDKFFMIADVIKGKTSVEWKKLDQIRPFVDRVVTLESQEDMTNTLVNSLPPQDQLKDAFVRLTVHFPHEWQDLIDEAALRTYAAQAFEFHLNLRPQMDPRSRLPQNLTMSALGPLDLLDLYFKSNQFTPEDIAELIAMAQGLINPDTDQDHG